MLELDHTKATFGFSNYVAKVLPPRQIVGHTGTKIELVDSMPSSGVEAIVIL